MTNSYNVGYSVDALGDLRELYSYIANELLVPETAAAQLGRIRKEVRSLDFMPARYTLVEWEPWHSMKMHQLPVDNFIVYYLVDDKERTVLLLRKQLGVAWIQFQELFDILELTLRILDFRVDTL